MKRSLWHAPDLSIPNKPLWIQMLRFRAGRVKQSDRVRVGFEGDIAEHEYIVEPNLVSSITDKPGWHLAVLDLDEPHELIPSGTPGHAHLRLNRPMRTWRWLIFMIGCRVAGVIEPGTFVWSLRRGGNFVRLPGVQKTDAERVYPEYGWFRKKRRR